MRPSRSKRVLGALLALALLASVPAGCGGGGGQALAEVNGEAVTARQLDQRLALFQIVFRHQVSAQEVQKMRAQFADMLVEEALLVQEAKKRGLMPQAGAVQAETRRLLEAVKLEQYNGSEPSMKRGLKEAGLSESLVQEIVARQMAVDAVTRKVTEPVRVGDADIRAYYEQNKARLVRPETVKLLRLQTKTREDADKALGELRNGKDFIEVARKYSSDPMISSHRGMSIDDKRLGLTPQVVKRGELPAELEQAAFSLAAGQVSQVIESRSAYHILKVEEKQAGGEPPFDEVKEQLRADLLAERQKQAFDKFLKDLKKSAQIRWNKNQPTKD